MGARALIDIAWSDEFATGIDIIDEQHQQLFEYFDQVQQMLAHNDIENLPLVVQGLVDYAISHNTFEESLMRDAGYPMLEAHHRVHENFKQRALSYKARLEAGEDPLVIAREARTHIGLWLMNHIRREDQHYAPYVKKYLMQQDKGKIRLAVKRFFGMQ